MNINHDSVLDASNLRCPLPLLRLKQALKSLAAGQIIKVISTDPASQSDFRAFCQQTGHQLLANEASDGNYYFWIKLKD